MNLIEDESLKGIFLLILAVACNFLPDLLSCKTQKLLNENMLAKHFVALVILYFAIDFTSGVSNEPQHPGKTMYITLLIYIAFILFTRMNIYFTVVSFLILGAIYVLNNFKQYYLQKEEDLSRIKAINTSINVLFITLIVLILVGAGSYFIKQRRDHGKNWSTFKYIFGTTNCYYLTKK